MPTTGGRLHGGAQDLYFRPIPEAGLHQELDVWRRACTLAVRVYRATEDFPDTERYGLVVQMRRAAVSLPSNIAEGASRRSPADFQRYLDIASGSLSELETQCLLSQEIGYLSSQVHLELSREMKDIRRMVNALYQSLNRPTRKSRESNRTKNQKPKTRNA